MAEQTCPNCGAEVPRETGQHATTPSAGVVQCPSCGATVTLDKPGAAGDQQAAEASGDVPRTPETPAGKRAERTISPARRRSKG
jgi:endogenous inhibitor of DNA gyrase (YacG/DUF329 family)